MPDVEAACRSVEYALDSLKLDGVNLQSHTAHRYLGHPDEFELYAELDRRKAVVFVHPGTHPTNKLIQLPWPGFMMEYLFDTTRAVVNLAFGGAIERFPRIRFVLPHAGGVMPYFAWRLSVWKRVTGRVISSV